MNWKLLPALVGICLLNGCAASTTPSTTAYVPSFTRVAKGYRPILPFYYPAVSYVGCEALTPEQIREIQQDFYRPIVKSDYQNLIGAIVVNGAANAAGTTFSIWLLDGRKLDSGEILPPASSPQDIGLRFEAKAIAMLQQAISPEKLREAKSVAPVGANS